MIKHTGYRAKGENMNLEKVIYEKNEKVITITLNRPEKLNALNDQLLDDFDTALQEAENDKEAAVLIIKGAGKAFCSGYDISGENTTQVDLDWRKKPYMSDLLQQQRRRQERIEKIAKFPKSTIAQVHGYCLEAGCSIAMACDVTIAAEDAKFGDPSVRMGLATESPFWYYMLGIKKAKELVLTGKMVDGKEAARIGLATMAVPADQVEAEVAKMAKSMCATPFDGLTNHREGFQAALDARGLAAGFRFAGEMRVFSVLQRPGSRDEEFNFFDVREKKGLKAALEEMNAPYKKLGY